MKNAKDVDSRAFFISDLIEVYIMHYSEDLVDLSNGWAMDVVDGK